LKKVTTEEINNKLLLATDNIQRTVLHVAAGGGEGTTYNAESNGVG